MQTYLDYKGLVYYNYRVNALFKKFGVDVKDISDQEQITMREDVGTDVYYINPQNTNITVNNKSCYHLPEGIIDGSVGIFITNQCQVFNIDETTRKTVNNFIISNGITSFRGIVVKINDEIHLDTGWTKSLTTNDFVEISKEDFEALPLSIRNNGTTYFITSNIPEVYVKISDFDIFKTQYETDLENTMQNIGTLRDESGNSIDVTLDKTTYKLNIALKNKNGDTLSTKEVDFPSELAFVDADYDKTNKKIVFVMENGTQVDVPIGDLVNGLVSESTFNTAMEGKANKIHTHDYLPLSGGTITGDVKVTGTLKSGENTVIHSGNIGNQSVSYADSAGNAQTVNNHNVNKDVPIDAKFTDTTYGVATSSTLGLVKSGTDITVDSSGNVSVNDDSHNHVINNIDGLQNALDGKASRNHTHNYAGSSSAGGSANSSKIPYGFNNRSGSVNWGNQTGTYVTDWSDSTGGSIQFRSNNPASGQLSALIDGYFYQREGQNRCLDTSDSSSFASSSHTHSNYISNSGANPTLGNGAPITQPGGEAAISIRTTSNVGKDAGIFYLSQDNAYIANSSDDSYTFGVFDTDQTSDMSNVDEAEFVVLGSGKGAKVTGDFNVKGTTMKLNNGSVSIAYNSTTESLDFVFN